jgi:hypothetical protein
VKVTIKNTGSVDADEVPQVYLGAPSEIPAGVQFPVRRWPPSTAFTWPQAKPKPSPCT